MKIEWILDEKAMDWKISHQAGVIRAVSRVAHEKAAIATGYLMAHRAEGYSSIEVTRGAVDSFVSLRDRPSKSNEFAPAAAAIEFGRGGKHPWQGVGALSRAFGIHGPHRRKGSGRAAGRPGG